MQKQGSFNLYSDVVNFLVKIEQEFDVNSLIYRDLLVWPIIRNHLWFFNNVYQPVAVNRSSCTILKDEITENYYFPTNVPQITKKNNFFLTKWKKLKNFNHNRIILKNENDRLMRHYSILKEKGPKDILFFTCPIYLQNILQGKHFDMFFDPLCEKINNKNSFLKIGIGNSVFKPKDVFHETPMFFGLPYSTIHTIVNSKKDNEVIKNYDSLIKYIATIKSSFVLQKETIIQTIRRLLVKEKIFDKMLSILNPKIIFIIEYGNDDFLPLIRASRKRNILSVDIEHGFMNESYGPYTHWTNIPKDGYDLLPNFIWSWNQKCKVRIQQHRNNNFHKVICGGHPYLTKYFTNPEHFAIKKSCILPKVLKYFRKIILVDINTTLIVLPRILIDAMKESQNDWFWLVRIHPMIKSQVEQIESILDFEQIDNYEVKLSTELPIYSLLNMVHVFITPGSTISVEALSFGIKTLLFGKLGEEIYSDFIEKGIFIKVESKDQILNEIKNDNYPDLQNVKLNLLLTDDNEQCKTLNQLLNLAGIKN
ncbi:MAG: hypothetical protein ACD_79C00287G0026 [uncultured bacterium]|nr:MAG: hypothetical protein ACD_79C00287G0026 [uncultured bacterium]